MTLKAKYPGTCAGCNKAIVPGQKINWQCGRKPSHVDCELARLQAAATPAPKWEGGRILVTEFSSGATVYRNARGRCEDAPCCGCCS